jgi:hypothetical protein
MPSPNGMVDASVSFFGLHLFCTSSFAFALFLSLLCCTPSLSKYTESNLCIDMQGNTPGSSEADGKPHEVKEKLPIKRSRGSMGSMNMVTGKNNELGKTPGAFANGIHTKR